MYISLFILSIIFFIVYFLFAITLFNKNNKEKYDIRNHFPFELWIKKGEDNVFINLILWISLTLFAVNYILFAVFDFSILSVISAAIVLYICFSIGVLFYLPLSKLKERSAFSISLITMTTIINAMIIWRCFTLIRQYENYLAYLPLVISSLIVVIGIIIIFNPKLFNFEMKKDESGVMSRPKYFHLAFSEWILIFISFFSQLYIVITSFIK